ncbi:MAG: polyprenyl synthetase family protein [Vicinamibacterales bacterium]
MSAGGEAVGLSEYLKLRRAAVDEALDRFLPRPPECPEAISAAMRYSLFAGGKRLRPILVLAAAESVSIHPDMPRAVDSAASAMRLAMPAACALEMVHTYSLIHDDLPAIDNDTMRRGRPTLHVVHGEAMAILAGDGLLTEALTLIVREPPDDDFDIVSRKLRAAAIVGRAAGVAGMVGGQVMDLEASGHAGPKAPPLARTAANLQAMHAAKTGALIRAAAVAGAVMAGAPPALVKAVDRFAADLGLAFQIVDDILDVEAPSEEIGKTAGKDAEAGKLTYPALFGMAESKRRARECIDSAEETLVTSGLTEGRLLDIAHWVTERRT